MRPGVPQSGEWRVGTEFESAAAPMAFDPRRDIAPRFWESYWERQGERPVSLVDAELLRLLNPTTSVRPIPSRKWAAYWDRVEHDCPNTLWSVVEQARRGYWQSQWYRLSEQLVEAWWIDPERASHLFSEENWQEYEDTTRRQLTSAGSEIVVPALILPLACLRTTQCSWLPHEQARLRMMLSDKLRIAATTEDFEIQLQQHTNVLRLAAALTLWYGPVAIAPEYWDQLKQTLEQLPAIPEKIERYDGWHVQQLPLEYPALLGLVAAGDIVRTAQGWQYPPRSSESPWSSRVPERRKVTV